MDDTNEFIDWLKYEPTDDEFEAQMFAHYAVWDYAYDNDDIYFPDVIYEDYTMDEWDEFLGNGFFEKFKEMAKTNDLNKLDLLLYRACEGLYKDEYPDWDSYWNPDKEKDFDEDEFDKESWGF